MIYYRKIEFENLEKKDTEKLWALFKIKVIKDDSDVQKKLGELITQYVKTNNLN